MESASNSIALHINPRIRDDILVRNSHIGGIWGKEEREINNNNPFAAGMFFDVSGIYVNSTQFNIHRYILKRPVFQMSVTCDNDKFKVSVDGQHLFDYHHRMPFSIIDKLEIAGDVEFSCIGFWDHTRTLCWSQWPSHHFCWVGQLNKEINIYESKVHSWIWCVFSALFILLNLSFSGHKEEHNYILIKLRDKIFVDYKHILETVFKIWCRKSTINFYCIVFCLFV